MRRRSFSAVASGEESESESESESGEGDWDVECWILDVGMMSIASRMSID